MEKRVELEIGYSWWMWRGYRGYMTGSYRDAIRQLNPMDRHDFEEGFAFPMQKPNFDVFGIPGRTRKQRGWYQVQRHPKSRPTQHIIFPTPKSSPDASATGVDLPMELVRLVGEMMSQRVGQKDTYMMVTCALVCRHWASQFLPKILNRVTIHSHKRAFGLWELDHSPARCFYRCCNSHLLVEIESLSELSFMHLLSQMRCKFDAVRLTGPLPGRWKTIRSVHQALPQSLPRFFSTGIKLLELTNIHFQRFSDLAHLVCELPDLEQLQCTKVSWGSLSDTIVVFPRPRRTQKHNLRQQYNLEIETHSDMWAQMGLRLLTHCPPHNSYPFFSPSVVLVLISLVNHFFPTNNTVNAQNSDAPSGVVWYESNDHGFCLGFHSEKFPVVHIQATQHASVNGEAPQLDITDVIVDFSRVTDSQHDQWKTFNSLEIDTHISLLNPARLIFAFRYREDLLAFGSDVADALMPRTSAHGPIRYAVLDKDTNWCKASRDSDVLQGSPTSCLWDLYKD